MLEVVGEAEVVDGSEEALGDGAGDEGAVSDAARCGFRGAGGLPCGVVGMTAERLVDGWAVPVEGGREVTAPRVGEVGPMGEEGAGDVIGSVEGFVARAGLFGFGFGDEGVAFFEGAGGLAVGVF